MLTIYNYRNKGGDSMSRKPFFLSLILFLLFFLGGCSDLPNWKKSDTGIVSPNGQIFEEVEEMEVLPNQNLGEAIGQYDGYLIHSFPGLSPGEWVVYNFDSMEIVYKKKDIPFHISQFEADGLQFEWQYSSPSTSSVQQVNNPFYAQHLVEAITKGETVPFQLTTNNIERIVYLTSKKYKGLGYLLYYSKGPQKFDYITTDTAFERKTFKVDAFPSK
jgi:hypothetical protein